MIATRQCQMEYNIARCRVVFSIAAFLVVYVDPGAPLLSRWIPFSSGALTMDTRLLVVMVSHLVYSVTIYLAILGKAVLTPSGAARTVWIDVLFAVTVATMTEGVTSPAYPFFAFAVVVGGLRGGLRQAMIITTVTLAFYFALLIISTRSGADTYIMRPVYLGITGYLVGYLGQQRLELQEQMRQLEVAEQRHRIGRELHDGYAQAMAGINLRLEGARRLLRANAVADAMTDLSELQESVKHEYDDLRRYARSLAGVEVTAVPGDHHQVTRLWMRADVSGSVELLDHVLSIAREGIRNVRRHAHARSATIDIRTEPAHVRIAIDDDGVGLDAEVTPWSIASRVKEIGGDIQMRADQGPGAHLLITLPQT